MKSYFPKTFTLILTGFLILIIIPAPEYDESGHDSSFLFRFLGSHSYAMQPDSVVVNFTVTIPFWTPKEDSIYLIGSTLPPIIPLSKVNDVTWTSKINLSIGETLHYSYNRGSETTKAKRTHVYTMSEYDSARYDAVLGWIDLESPVSKRDNFMGLVAMMDFPAPGIIEGWWDRDNSGNYSDLVETYIKIRDRAGLNYVGYPEGAYYSELLPLPVIVDEDQGMRDLNASEFKKIIELAGENNLQYYVHCGNPGINHELALQVGTDNPFGWVPQNITSADTSWWREFFKQWGDFLEPKAILAESLGVKLFSIGGDLDYVDYDYNAFRWINLINRIRNVYSEKLIYFSLNYQGPNPNWSSYLDYIGIYMGRPIASSNNPTISELVDGISTFVDDTQHPKPVIFFLDFASIDSTAMGVPYPDILEPTAHLQIDFQEQADIYEAFFCVMKEREWIAGVLSWNYAYHDNFLFNPSDDYRFTPSIRNKLAEAVTFKWRHTFDTTATIVGVPDVSTNPKNYKLFQNYPNPFNPTTNIKFIVPKTSKVVLKVYNMLGEEIKTLVENTFSPGIYLSTWGGLDNSGYKVSTGLYIYRIEMGNHIEIKKCLLLK
jgi:hypothetical protein